MEWRGRLVQLVEQARMCRGFFLNAESSGFESDL